MLGWDKWKDLTFTQNRFGDFDKLFAATDGRKRGSLWVDICVSKYEYLREFTCEEAGGNPLCLLYGTVVIGHISVLRRMKY